LGGRHHSRLLVRQGLGRFAIFDADRKLWNARKFEERCAGCHSTAVDPKDRTFAYHGLDCYTCHGDVPLKHASDSALVLLSKKRRDDARLVGSICASCHARGGVSESTGLPYPNNFVPGDNLFLDFPVKFDQVEDAHVARSIRETALGASSGTCLSCHSIHGASTEKHRRVLSSAICLDCHIEGRPRKEVRPVERRSRTCEY
jgi:predicted CXXCH cytochrome family protein